MRRKLLIVPIILFSLLLAGCSLDMNDLLSFLNQDDSNEEIVNNDNEKEANQDENNEANEVEEPNLDGKEILTKSYEAMNEIESFGLEMHVLFEEQDADDYYEEERVLTFAGFTQDPYHQYATIQMEGIVGDEALKGEAYKVDHKHYFYTSNEGDEWYVTDFPFEPDYFEFYPIDTYLKYSDQYTVTDDGDSYYLEFAGDYDQFFQALYGIVYELIPEVMIAEPYAEYDGDVVEEGFAISIHKDTYLVQAYHLYGIEQGITDYGDYEMKSTVTINFDNYNDIPAIEVPDDVIANAIDLDEKEAHMQDLDDNYGDNFSIPEGMPADFPMPDGIEVLFTSNQSIEETYAYMIGFTFDPADFEDEALEAIYDMYEAYGASIDYQTNGAPHDRGEFKITGTPQDPDPDINEYFIVEIFPDGDIMQIGREEEPFGKIQWRSAR